MLSPFSLLHQHMGSMLDAFEHETFPLYGQPQRSYRGYRRQPDLYRSLYDPYPATSFTYRYPSQPHYHLIDVSLPTDTDEVDEQEELSVEEQLRQQLAQQKQQAASQQQQTTANNKDKKTAGAAAAATDSKNGQQQQQLAARDSESTNIDPINRLFRSLFRPSTAAALAATPAELAALQQLRVDVSEDASGMMVQAEIAGLAKEDVQLTVKDHVLTISATKQSKHEQTADDGKQSQQGQQAAAAGKEPAEEKVKEGTDDGKKTASTEPPGNNSNGRRVLHRELYYGSVSRSLRLPRHADLSAISAEAKDGLLTVRVPYKQTKEPEQRTITIS